MSSQLQALFLDRDGTLIEWVHYLSDPNEVSLTPGVATELRKAKQAGCLLFLHTNQSGVGRGYFTSEAVEACNQRMFELLQVQPEFFDGICIATDHPEQADETSYRKPNPRFEEEQIKKRGLDPQRCFMIGDRASDIGTGLNAGIKVALVGGHEPSHQSVPSDVPRFATLAEFLRRHF